MIRLSFFRQKSRKILLVLAAALVICGCGRKAPPRPPELTSAAAIEPGIIVAAPGCTGQCLQAGGEQVARLS